MVALRGSQIEKFDRETGTGLAKRSDVVALSAGEVSSI